MKSRPTKKPPCGRPVPAESRKGGAQEARAWRERLEKHLRDHQLRFSEQRFQIAELILAQSGHLSAPEIVAAVKRAHPGIGAATVYRNIKTLCEARILKESFSDAGGQAVYERYDEDHHDHIVCLDCGWVFEFHSEKIEALQREVTRALWFSESNHRHVIYGRCEYRR